MGEFVLHGLVPRLEGDSIETNGVQCGNSAHPGHRAMQNELAMLIATWQHLDGVELFFVYRKYRAGCPGIKSTMLLCCCAHYAELG